MPEKDRGNRKILAGIRRILEVMKEERKQAAEDRNRADSRFEGACRRGDRDRKDFRRLLIPGVGKVGMDIRRSLHAVTAVLHRIDRRLETMANGRRRGNGRSNRSCPEYVSVAPISEHRPG